MTVYIHPARYTQEFMAKYDTLQLASSLKASVKALGYLGSHSGRNEDKVANSGLTPVAVRGWRDLQRSRFNICM